MKLLELKLEEITLISNDISMSHEFIRAIDRYFVTIGDATDILVAKYGNKSISQLSNAKRCYYLNILDLEDIYNKLYDDNVMYCDTLDITFIETVESYFEDGLFKPLGVMLLYEG